MNGWETIVFFSYVILVSSYVSRSVIIVLRVVVNTILIITDRLERLTIYIVVTKDLNYNIILCIQPVESSASCDVQQDVAVVIDFPPTDIMLYIIAPLSSLVSIVFRLGRSGDLDSTVCF